MLNVPAVAELRRRCRAEARRERQAGLHWRKLLREGRLDVEQLSFRKLFANGRALFANDPGDRQCSLNKYTGPDTLIVTCS